MGLFDILEIVNSDRGHCTCVGHAPSKGRRCWNKIAQHNEQRAFKLIEELEQYYPDMKPGEPALQEIATLLLCVRWHRDQAKQVATKWYSVLNSSRSNSCGNGFFSSKQTRFQSYASCRPATAATTNNYWPSNPMGSGTYSQGFEHHTYKAFQSPWPKNPPPPPTVSFSWSAMGSTGSIHFNGIPDESLISEFLRKLNGKGQYQAKGQQSYSSFHNPEDSDFKTGSIPEMSSDDNEHEEEQQQQRAKSRPKPSTSQKEHGTTSNGWGESFNRGRENSSYTSESTPKMPREDNNKEQKQQQSKERPEPKSSTCKKESDRTSSKRSEPEDNRKHSERIREQARKAREENERLKRQEAQAEKEEYTVAWSSYTERWAKLKENGSDSGATCPVPWPVLSGELKDVGKSNVEKFFRKCVLETLTPTAASKRLRTECLHWHPDKMARMFRNAELAIAERMAFAMITQVVVDLRTEAKEKRNA